MRDGTLDDEIEVATGDLVRIPAGTPHCYLNASGAPATLLVFTSGNRQVPFLRGMSRLTATGRPEPEALAAHTAAHGVTMM